MSAGKNPEVPELGPIAFKLPPPHVAHVHSGLVLLGQIDASMLGMPVVFLAFHPTQGTLHVMLPCGCGTHAKLAPLLLQLQEQNIAAHGVAPPLQ